LATVVGTAVVLPRPVASRPRSSGILASGGPAIFPIKKILHPTDFSERSEDAFLVACTLARDQGAHLVILHVVPPPVPAEPGEQELRDYREEMRHKLQHLKAPYLAGQVERVLREGDVAAEVPRTAQGMSCDLIVMGTHGLTGELRRLLGSVAEVVTREAPCPILCLKGALPRAAPAEPPVREEVDVVL
jgi:nucleotide-binding universal stress UspA family protein